MNTADDALLEGVRVGAPDLASIYAEHREAMLRSASAVLFHSEDRIVDGVSATDVVQDVVLRLRERGLPRDIENLRAHLVTVTTRAAIDVLRKSRIERRDALGKERIPRHEPLPPAYADTWVDAGADVEEIVQRNLLREALLECLPALPEREQYVLRERIIQARPAKDVAAALQVTPQRVSQLVTAAARRLRDMLEK